MASAVQEVLPHLWIPLLNRLPYVMGLLGCISITHVHLHSLRGLLGTIRGLQNEIKLVPIDLQNRPAWYKEKFYPENKVPSLEHNNKVCGESLDLLKYLHTHFGGRPALLPDVRYGGEKKKNKMVVVTEVGVASSVVAPFKTMLILPLLISNFLYTC